MLHSFVGSLPLSSVASNTSRTRRPTKKRASTVSMVVPPLSRAYVIGSILVSALFITGIPGQNLTLVSEGDVDLLATEEYLDPHAVAGLLKSFLRDLPDSILTRELHLRFLAVIGEF